MYKLVSSRAETIKQVSPELYDSFYLYYNNWEDDEQPFSISNENRAKIHEFIYLCKNTLKFQPKSWEPELDCDKKLHNYFPKGYLGVERKVSAGYSLRIFNPRDWCLGWVCP